MHWTNFFFFFRVSEKLGSLIKSKNTNQSNHQMLLISASLILLSIYLLIKLYEYKLQYTVIHSETGIPLQFHGGLFSPILKIFSSTSSVRKSIKEHQQYGEIFGTCEMFRYRVSTSSPEIAKKVLTDQKNFSKGKQAKIGDVNHGVKKLFNDGDNVVFSDGEMWKRQRKSVNPGFYNLSIYTPKIIEKINLTMEYFKSNSNVKDIHDILQKFTL
jgi:hypothetical protein